MTRYFLTRVSIEGFRGVNNEGKPLVLKFEPSAVNSVFAANGSGKSSIYEALQYAFSGSVPRLASMQSAEQPDRYVGNLFHSQGVATIGLAFQPDGDGDEVAIEVVRTADGRRQVSGSGTDDPERFLADLNQDFALLDYAKFSKFIEDTALDRGRSFSSLLGLSPYSEYRRALKAADTTQSFRTDFDVAARELRRDQLIADRQRAIADLSLRYEQITGLGGALTDWSTSREEAVLTALRGVALLSEQLGASTKLEDVDFMLLKEAVKAAERGPDRSRLEQLIKKCDSIAATKSRAVAAWAAYDELLQKAKNFEDAVSEASSANLRGLLQAADQYFRSGSARPGDENCPLCGATAEGLHDHTVERLRAYEDIEAALQTLAKEAKRSDFVDYLRELEAFGADRSRERASDSILDAIRRGTLSLQQFVSIKQDAVGLENELQGELEVAVIERERLEQGLPPSLVELTSQLAHAEAARALVEELARSDAELEKSRRALATIERWRAFISAAHIAFAGAESALSRSTLDALETDYRALFRQIMTVDSVVPTLERSTKDERLSVELADFHGARAVSARAVLSESYRNALAISVFLAAASRHGRAPRFIVMDDVTSSFDSGHQYQLMEALRTTLQFRGNAGLQFVILSHDVTLEKYFDRLNEGNDWRHQKLLGWPPSTPISTHQQSPDRLEAEARRFLEAGQMQEGAGFIRQYLEFVVLQVIRKVKIPVPIDLAVNDHAKMVHACLEAVVDAVDTRSRLQTIVLTDQQVEDISRRHAPAIVANWVSHYSTSGPAAFSPPFLLGVLDSISALRRCFQFENPEGNWRYYKSLTQRE